MSEAYNTNVCFFTIIGNNHVVILRDAEIQDHTANAWTETVYTVLLDIAETSGIVSQRPLPTDCMSLVFHRGERLKATNRDELQPRWFISGQETGFTDVFSLAILR